MTGRMEQHKQKHTKPKTTRYLYLFFLKINNQYKINDNQYQQKFAWLPLDIEKSQN